MSKKYLKKQSKKSKKSHKKRQKTRKHKGGRGFTTSVETNPIQYKEDEYDQFRNALNYNPTKM